MEGTAKVVREVPCHLAQCGKLFTLRQEFELASQIITGVAQLDKKTGVLAAQEVDLHRPADIAAEVGKLDDGLLMDTENITGIIDSRMVDCRLIFAKQNALG